MGQNYSIELFGKVKPGCEQNLIDSVHIFVKDRNMSDECKNDILKSKKFKKIVETCFGPSLRTRKDTYYGWDKNKWRADFKATYSWDDFMYNAFKELGKYLEPKSYLSCDSESDNWTLEVTPNGEVVEKQNIILCTDGVSRTYDEYTAWLTNLQELAETEPNDLTNEEIQALQNEGLWY